MQQILVKRYAEPAAGYLGSVEPEDRSWILFLHQEGPELWERTEEKAEDGSVTETYQRQQYPR